MTSGVYFVSDEAENAATQRVITQFKSAKEAKAKLEGELSALSEKFSAFAKVLARPSDYPFRVERNSITVGTPPEEGPARRPFVRLDPSDLDWQHLSETLTNYEKARTDKKDAAARLKNMGLDGIDLE
jgi:hypothetical protein